MYWLTKAIPKYYTAQKSNPIAAIIAFKATLPTSVIDIPHPISQLMHLIPRDPRPLLSALPRIPLPLIDIAHPVPQLVHQRRTARSSTAGVPPMPSRASLVALGFLCVFALLLCGLYVFGGLLRSTL